MDAGGVTRRSNQISQTLILISPVRAFDVQPTQDQQATQLRTSKVLCSPISAGWTWRVAVLQAPLDILKWKPRDLCWEWRSTHPREYPLCVMAACAPRAEIPTEERSPDHVGAQSLVRCRGTSWDMIEETDRFPLPSSLSRSLRREWQCTSEDVRAQWGV